VQRTISRELRTKLTPQQVWDVLLDPQRGPFWRAQWAGTVRYSLKVEQRAWRQASAGSCGLVFEEKEAEAPRRLVLAGTAPQCGVWRFDIEAADGETIVRIGAEVQDGFSLSSLLGGPGAGKTAERFCDDLATRLYCG
jgi:hypothetical protein